MKYVLDTNVVSELMKPVANHKVVDWFHDFGSDVFLNVIAIEELYYGIFLMPDGKKKAKFSTDVEMILKECEGKRLDFDGFCGFLCAKARADARRNGRVVSPQDCMIAAICQRHGATLVTRNVKDFEQFDIDIVNPFEYESETLKMLRKREAERERAEAQGGSASAKGANDPEGQAS